MLLSGAVGRAEPAQRRVRFGADRREPKLGVDRDDSAGAGEDRVEVELGDFGKVLGEPAEAQQQVLECAVSTGGAPR